jgi:DNA-directed RNA polymerase subunit RPC12/RpoP
MSAASIRFCCAHCQASLKAPAELAGRNRNCPGCGGQIVVPRRIPEDAGAVLVLLESEERFALIAPRPLRYATPRTEMPYRLRQSA